MRRCALPQGSHLAAQDASARLVVFDQERQVGEADIRREWRYCWRKSGGYHTLAASASYSSGAGAIVDVSRVVLSGPWASWAMTTIQYGGRYGYPIEGTISVRY